MLTKRPFVTPISGAAGSAFKTQGVKSIVADPSVLHPRARAGEHTPD